MVRSLHQNPPVTGRLAFFWIDWGAMSIFQWLFDTSMGPPGPNGQWPAWLSIAFHAANFMTAFHLFTVPVIVASLWQFRRDGVKEVDYWRIMSMFPFLAAARLIRFCEMMGPPYHITTLIDIAAAISTAYSVSALPRLVKHVLMLPSRDEIHALNRELNRKNLESLHYQKALKDRNALLRDRIIDLERLMELEGWSHEKRIALEEIRQILKQGPPNGN